MKLRVRLTKAGKARFLSHLDMISTLERTFRRASIPVALTQGFNVHPRISFASALATGTSSEGEFLDVDLASPMELLAFTRQVNQSAPEGIRVVEARLAPSKGDSLFSLIDAAEYRITLRLPPGACLGEAVDAFLSRDVVEMEKENKRGKRMVNIRTQVLELKAEGEASLWAVLQTGSQGNLKPEDLLVGLQAVSPAMAGAELGLAHRLMLYHRDARSGALVEPWDL